MRTPSRAGATTWALAATVSLVVAAPVSEAQGAARHPGRAASKGPTTLITFGPEGVVDRDTATFAFTADPPAARFLCSRNGSSPAPCVSPVTYGKLADGPHWFSVEGVDAHGTPLPAAQRSWTVDTSALTRITSGPTGTVAGSGAVFEFVSRDPASRFVCSIDRAPFGPCASPKTYTGLGNGRHRFVVASVDASGSFDPNPAQRDFDIQVPRTDLCPGTPRGEREVHQGCSAAEMVANPGLLTEPSLARLEEAELRLVHAAYRETSAALGRARTLIRAAGEQLGQGSVCEAAATSAQAKGELAGADRAMGTAVRRRQAELLPDRADAGDATDTSIAAAVLRLHEKLMYDDTAAAREALAGFDAGCAAVAGRLSDRVRIARTEDFARRLRLDTGTTVVIPEGEVDVALVQGMDVGLEGILFDDGAAVATGFEGAIPSGSGLTLQCMALRIAPVQRLAPEFPGPYSLHRPDGYQSTIDGVLQLERWMGLAAVATGCAGADSEGWALHYSMRIDLAQGNAYHYTMAHDLEDGEPPVRLPLSVPVNEPITISRTVYRTRCHPQIPLACGTPEIVLSESSTAIVRPVGSYAAANYARTVFGVADNLVPGDFESTEVVSFQLDAAGSVDNAFVAEGYRVDGVASSRPAVLPIAIGQSFAVYEDDFTDPQSPLWPFVLGQTGQSSAGGLRWARVSGKRNGSAFSYSARLPRLIRDRVTECPQGVSSVLPTGGLLDCNGDGTVDKQVPTSPFVLDAVKDTFYKIPFSYGFVPGHGNMNIDDPVECQRHGASQAYALDLGAPQGEVLRAARGGKVVTVEENQPNMLPGGGCGGNYMWIRHQDGTFAVYFHMVPDGVDVSEGQFVKRGQAVARTGTTGCSSGPHVHFGVHAVEGVTPGAIADGNSLRVLYEIGIPSPVLDATVSCFIPRAEGAFSSTNAQP
jgi:hypothetical protein